MRCELRTLLLLTLVSACSSNSDGSSRSAREAPAVAVEASDPPAAAEEGEAEVDETETSEVIAAPGSEVIEIAGPKVEREGNVVPVRAIDLIATEVAWREVVRLPVAGFEFVEVASGVVARSKAGVYELDDGELVARPELTLPDGPLLGHWPDDVWSVEATPVEPDDEGRERFEYRLSTLDRERRWTVERYRRKDRWIGEALAARKGWHGGVLVREGSTLTRLGNRRVAPKIGMRMGKIILDVIETSSGRLHSISLRPNGIYVQQTCFNQSCVDDNAKKLPFGSDWRFSTQIPRQRNSLSLLATVNDGGVVSHQLLHYEIGGWSLETLVHAPAGMWASAEGGLWVLVGDALRYRTPKGEWLAVALPEGVGKVSAAIDGDLDELWIASKSGNEAIVFVTSANATPAED